MYRIAVCDDDQRELEQNVDMTRHILEHKGMTKARDYEIDAYPSQSPLIEKLSTQPRAYDLLLLDIEMPGDNGLELASLLRKKRFEASIIYITHHPGFAMDSFPTFPLEYLLKPVDETRLSAALERDLRRVNPPKRSLLQIGASAVFLDDILYLEVAGRKTAVHTKEEVFLLPDSLSNLKTSLLEQGFFHTHFSFLVNLTHIKRVERTAVLLDNGKEIPVSRRYYQALMDRYIESLA